MGDSHHLTLDNASQAWDTLAERVDSLIAAWEGGGEPPDLEALVAEVPAELRRIVLVELIKTDLEHRWERPQFRQGVEVYFEQFPELAADGNVPCDLLFEEYHIRLRAGDRVDPATYFERYPAQATELKRLLEVGTTNQSTMLFASDPPNSVCAGDRLDDFDLVSPLGKGAFASVFLARQRSMQRLVALKISSDRGDEPQTLAQLDHPNIVRVYDQRVLEDRKMRLLYMQLVPGGTLQTVNETLRTIPQTEWSGSRYVDSVDQSLEQTGHTASAESSIRRRLEAATWGEAVAWIGARLAAALGYAHQMGVLHRDVKPANVLLDAEGSPKLADFNISFCSKVEGATPAAFFGGSLAYMSPEQLQAYNPAHGRTPDDVDARSDIYSLGVVLWELLCGQRPFGDERMQDSWPETLEQMTARRLAGVDPQANWRPPPGCPAGLDEILLKCLAPDPEARWQSAAEVATQLELCLQPEVRELVQIRPDSWRDMARRMPILMVMLVTLQPNVLAAIFNYYYNLVELAARLEAAHLLWLLQLVINGVAFPLGISVGIYLIWPVARGLRARERMEADDAAWLRQRALCLGHYVALIGIVLWLVAAPAYPICLSLLGVSMSWEDYLHFMGSLTISGLIAAAYPFFFVSYLSTRVFYPALLRPEEATRKDVAALRQLGRLSYVYLYLAGAVPGLGVLLLALIKSDSQPALVIVSAGGVLCFPFALLLYRAIQRDLDRLAIAVGEPSGASRATTT